ncbi:MAG: glycerophosphodiester phosphodiesterase [Dehalococcoidia bacterium]
MQISQRVTTWHFPPGSLDSPLIIAHRGDLTSAPENTLPAFQHALAAGADGIELDVRLSSDGQLLVFHDRSLGRTCDGRGPVNHYSLAQLQRLDVGSWFGGEYQGLNPPTLDEVFQAMPLDFLVNVEMKVIIKDMRTIALRVGETIGRYQRWESTLVASFNPVALYYLRRLYPRVARGYIWSKRHPFPIRSRFLSPLARPHWYDPAHESYNHRLHRKFHRRGHHLLAWDVDFDCDLKRMAEARLDAVVTDRLDSLLAQKQQLASQVT